ncbi:MAG: NIPSNAP family protein [Limisphaerales bacterium]
MDKIFFGIFLTAVLNLAPIFAAEAATSSSLANKSRCFEMRTYYAAPGKLEALHARFRDHTNRLFVQHGMELIGYWVPMDRENHYENKLVYILAYPSREAREKSWKDFQNDGAWKTARDASEQNGKLVEKVDSVFMTATDYSPIK